MKTSNLRYLLVVSAALSLGASDTLAQPGSSQYIQSVKVSGNGQVSTDKILRVLRVKKGESVAQAKIPDGLKRLFGTKQFNDLRAWIDAGTHPDSVVLLIEVDEYPKIDRVAFDGNGHIDDEDLEKEISIGRGTFVRPAVVGRDSEKIADLYREKGYYRVTVKDSLSYEGVERVLVYRIDEGEKVSVKHVDFLGVRGLDTGDLRKVMKTKEDRWFRGADFKPKEFEADETRIIQLYREKGYLDIEIKDRKLVFSDDGKDLDIYLTVKEGTRFSVGDISWRGNEIFPDSIIAGQISLEKGDVFNDLKLTEIQFNIGNLYGDRGYIYSNVTPVKSVERDTIDIDFEIVQGGLAHVHEINIEGNTKTAEQVIRRELVLHPGDVFASGKLRRSLREVFNLGFFAGPPNPSVERANDEGDIDVTLRVEERPAGQFRMGAGFSQLNRISGFIGVTEPNFLGRGMRVAFDWEFSRFRKNISVELTEPWVMGTPTELSVSVYSRIQNQVRRQFFSDRRTGFSLRVGRPFPWMDYTSVFARYSFEQVELSNFSALYTGSLLNTRWPQTTSSFGMTLVRNSTDNPFHPTSGSRTVLKSRWTGGLFGRDIAFQRYEASMKWYYPLFWKFVLEVSEELGVLDGYGKPDGVPDYELFRLGGNRRYALRGYDFYAVVPQGNPTFVGGRFMNILTYQLWYPVAPPMVYGLFFLDTGNTWNSFTEADMLNLKKGAGLGVRIELPMLGTVGIDYGYGFDRIGGGSWTPHITFGGQF